jgi:hypothetical protein
MLLLSLLAMIRLAAVLGLFRDQKSRWKAVIGDW